MDLLFNGGIGTYVKASTESNSEVGDRANDSLRVDGIDLRCRAVVEGGNLGLTQRGRIEYALAGGLVNTDAIDNSAGVDTSDHEVNIKILLDGAVAAGDLTVKQRNVLLDEMADEVADLVLRSNYEQNRALANARAQTVSMIDVHARYIRSLEHEDLIDRTLEFLPTERQLADRQSSGVGLTTPSSRSSSRTRRRPTRARSSRPSFPMIPSSPTRSRGTSRRRCASGSATRWIVTGCDVRSSRCASSTRP